MFSFFRKKFIKRVAAGDRQYARGELGLARGEYAEALERFTDADDRAELDRIKTRLGEIHVVLARREIDEARRLIPVGSIEGAVRCLDAAIVLARGHDDALKAEAERAIEELESAEAAADEPAEAPQHLEDPDSEFELLIQPFDDEREAAYRSLQEREPGGDAFRDGYLVLNHGDWAQALEHFDRAVAGSPDPISPWLAYERGRALVLAERFGDAVVDLRIAADAIDGALVAPVLIHLADAAIRVGDFEGAEAAIDRYAEQAESDADRASAVLLRVRWCLAQDRVSDGIELLRARLEQTPGALGLWRALGQVYEDADRPVEAIDAYEQVMSLHWRLNPDLHIVECDAFSANRLANLLIDRGERLDRALQLITALEMLVDPNDVWAIAILRSRALAGQGDDVEAVTVLEQALELLPDDAPEEARTQLESALAARAPESSEQAQ